MSASAMFLFCDLHGIRETAVALLCFQECCEKFESNLIFAVAGVSPVISTFLSHLQVEFSKIKAECCQLFYTTNIGFVKSAKPCVIRSAQQKHIV